MRRFVVALALVVPLGCRRHHVPPPEVEEPAAATTPTAGAVPVEPAPAPPGLDQKLPMPDGGTLNGDPRGPRPAELDHVLQAANPQLRACFDDATPPLPPGSVQAAVHFTLERGGYTGAVRARGEAPAEVLHCLERVVEALRFPEYHGDKIERDVPLTWTKKETVVPAAVDAAVAK